MTVNQLYSTFNHDLVSRFQNEFAQFVLSNKHDVVVETGEGVSTVCLLNAVPDIKLYSVDPNPWSNFAFEDKRHFPIRERSFEGLPQVFKKSGPWDFFLHDGNHDIKAMTYDLEMAYCCVAHNGYIACDDWTWGNHGAWNRFTARHSLESFPMGSLMIAQKSHSKSIASTDLDFYHSHALQIAEKHEKEWLALGNQNTPIFIQ